MKRKKIKKIINKKTIHISNETLIETFGMFQITNGQFISSFKLNLNFSVPKRRYGFSVHHHNFVEFNLDCIISRV